MKLWLIVFSCLVTLVGQAQYKIENEPEAEVEYELVRLDKQVNSPYHEGAPIISSDGQTLYFFVADHPDNNYGTKGSQDIWYAERTTTGIWGPAKHMSAPLNQHRYNQVMSISQGGNLLLVRGGVGKSSLGFSVCHRTKSGWSQPIPLRIKDYEKMAKGVYSGGILTGKGRVLLMYFNEVKDENISDLYVSFLQDGNKWTKPKFIESLNTKQDDFGPFMGEDETILYFASGRPGGSGSADIYATKKLDDTWLNWSDPINVGPPVNTKSFDAYYSKDAKGNVFTTRAYVTRDGGSLDILTLIPKIIEKVKPTIMVWGNVYDKKTGEPIGSQVIYEIHDLDIGNLVADDYDGFYELPLPGSGEYGIKAKAEGYMDLTEGLEVASADTNQLIQKDLFLDPIEIGTTVRLENIFFDFDKTTLRPESFTELDQVLAFLEDNPNVEIEISGHTDSKGSGNYNLRLSDGRAAAVRDYLRTKWISEGRVVSRGYGETVPLDTNDTDEGRQMNRRVEFTILAK